jgi:hypothetical protein
MKHRRKSIVLGIVFAAAFAVAFIAMIGQAWKAVSEGHGAETYENVYGMPIHWATVLVLSAALLLAFAVGIAVRWWQTRDVRALDRIRGQRDDA